MWKKEIGPRTIKFCIVIYESAYRNHTKCNHFWKARYPVNFDSKEVLDVWKYVLRYHFRHILIIFNQKTHTCQTWNWLKGNNSRVFFIDNSFLFTQRNSQKWKQIFFKEICNWKIWHFFFLLEVIENTSHNYSMIAIIWTP